MKLLIIRPQPGNNASAKRAREAGFEPLQLPFFEVRARGWDAPDPSYFDALLITSANAVRHAGGGLDVYEALPVHAVGRNSADAVAAKGQTLASTGTKGVDEALQLASAAGHHRLLWLTGEDHTRLEEPESLRVETRIVYAAEPAKLPSDARAIVASADMVALHSARGAQKFAEFVDAQRLSRTNLRLAAFSEAIAAAAGSGWQAIAIAHHPSDEALLSAARALGKQARI
ncbi:MAG: uroporphyrinogen-III synthase [Sphingorhabdus sp.]|uniref:uroporphyrinogen-III synthase n=1 Tax=Sphingorhabdus sp. TaxID=1902408 RepID=UPI003CA141CC